MCVIKHIIISTMNRINNTITEVFSSQLASAKGRIRAIVLCNLLQTPEPIRLETWNMQAEIIFLACVPHALANNFYGWERVGYDSYLAVYIINIILQ